MMLTGTAQRARRLAAFLDYTPASDAIADESRILPLWCAVAELAIEDIRSTKRDWQAEHYRDTAVAWFMDKHGVWVELCD